MARPGFAFGRKGQTMRDLELARISVETTVPVPPDLALASYSDLIASGRWSGVLPLAQRTDDPIVGTSQRTHGDDSNSPDRSSAVAWRSPNDQCELPVVLDDGRIVLTTFQGQGGGTRVRILLDPTPDAPFEAQWNDWRSLLEDFRAYIKGEALDG